jgi:hypothetical protein
LLAILREWKFFGEQKEKDAKMHHREKIVNKWRRSVVYGLEKFRIKKEHCKKARIGRIRKNN